MKSNEIQIKTVKLFKQNSNTCRNYYKEWKITSFLLPFALKMQHFSVINRLQKTLPVLLENPLWIMHSIGWVLIRGLQLITKELLLKVNVNFSLTRRIIRQHLFTVPFLWCRFTLVLSFESFGSFDCSQFLFHSVPS